MERAAQKWRALPGPDAWTQSLFRLEAMARAARDVGDWPLAARMAQLMLEHDPAYAGTHYALALVAAARRQRGHRPPRSSSSL